MEEVCSKHPCGSFTSACSELVSSARCWLSQLKRTVEKPATPVPMEKPANVADGLVGPQHTQRRVGDGERHYA